ncbi:serine hydrolase domain-containing protein [Kitasatospora sp. NPDC058048]|uniref:serine hydrolase domain-containing protein n=1 Tax=Kitasatospora sp. NPDC058048 TaxID=3346313 RepID=UPI0036DC5229
MVGTSMDGAGRTGARPATGRRRVSAVRVAAVVLAGAGLVAGVVPAANAQDTVGATAVGAAADQARRVDRAALDAGLRAVVVPGGATAALGRVDEDGRTLWKGAAGTADLTTGEPAAARDRFRIGSATKTFVATVVLQLVAEHRIGLDDPVEKHLPGVVRDGAGISIRQLLNHTGGIYNYTSDPAFAYDDDATFRTWLSTDRWKSRTMAELVAVAETHPAYFPPGQDWHYSNTDYILLGMLIEKTTGRSWQQEVDRRIIRPLGLSETTMPENDPAVPGRHTRAYVSLPGGPVDVTLFNPSIAGPAGAGISTTADLAAFMSALLGGRLLGPAELAEMKHTTGLGRGADYGLGLERTPTPCGDFWGHRGDSIGYSSVMLADDTGRRQVVLSRNPYDPAGLPASEAAFTSLVTAAACAGRTA